MRRFALAVGLTNCFIAGCTINVDERDPGEGRSTVQVRVASEMPAFRSGQQVIVHLRRDVLGFAGGGPMGIDQAGRYDAATSIEGRLEEATERWVTLQQDKRVLHVPVDVILAIELSGGATTLPSK